MVRRVIWQTLRHYNYRCKKTDNAVVVVPITSKKAVKNIEMASPLTVLNIKLPQLMIKPLPWSIKSERFQNIEFTERKYILLIQVMLRFLIIK